MLFYIVVTYQCYFSADILIYLQGRTSVLMKQHNLTELIILKLNLPSPMYEFRSTAQVASNAKYVAGGAGISDDSILQNEHIV